MGTAFGDQRLVEIFRDALRVSGSYEPHFGTGGAVTLNEFQRIYGADPFCAWLGLTSPVVFAAHRAAGQITSVYRQLGLACERLFVMILVEHLALGSEDVVWSYKTERNRTRSLDARIPFDQLSNPALFRAWAGTVGRGDARGIVFELRQGHKSQDSKRQVGDQDNAAQAIREGYVPVLFMFSNQLDVASDRRYQRNGWVVLRGTVSGAPTESSYSFFREVVGYDLLGFFERNAADLRQLVEQALGV